MLFIEKILNLPLLTLNHWGYYIIFLFTVLEALPFGFLIPGHSLVIFSGFLARLGILDIGDLMVIASLGAIIGDWFNYMLGRKYGYSFISKYGHYFFLNEKIFKKTRKLMNDHTGKTLIIGRFNPLTRSFAPFIAGASEVKIWKFLAYNIIGGVSWAVSSILLGYIFGQGYKIAAKYFGEFTIITILIIIAVTYGYNYYKKKKSF